jgi:hypothetical protein
VTLTFDLDSQLYEISCTKHHSKQNGPNCILIGSCRITYFSNFQKTPYNLQAQIIKLFCHFLLIDLLFSLLFRKLSESQLCNLENHIKLIRFRDFLFIKTHFSQEKQRYASAWGFHGAIK